MKRQIISCILCLLLTGCAAIGRPALNPTIIFWHSWQDNQESQLIDAITRFENIFDDITVVLAYVPLEDVAIRYQEAVAQGLGPDILLTSSDLIRTFANTNSIQSIKPTVIDTTDYYLNAIAGITFGNDIQAVPLGMNPQVLFYNADIVDMPPSTLDELLQDTNNGFGIALNSRFDNSLWGIAAYGGWGGSVFEGQILDETGRVNLNEGGLVNWFNWLQTAQLSSGVVLSRDEETLQSLFTRERVAYYIGNANELAFLREELEGETVQVAPLPSGINGRAGSLLRLDVLVFNPASSASQQDASIQLAQFLTNTEQSTTFMREFGLVPANRRVRVDPRAFPSIATIVVQARNTIPIINSSEIDLLLETGDTVLIQVLEGVLAPATAAETITRIVNESLGFETAITETPCELEGEITVWHSWTDSALTWLTFSESRFDSPCRDATVELAYIPARDLQAAYLEAYAEGDAPDILIAPSEWLVDLVQADAVMPLTSDGLQQYLEVAQNTVRYNSTFYAMPMTIETQALYFNRDLVQTAPATYEEWLTQLRQGTTAILPEMFMQTAWGWSAFGGVMIDESNELVINGDGAEGWLTWLITVDQLQTVTTSSSQFRRISQFVDGDAAYLVDSTTLLNELENELGDALQVTLFPTGSSGESRPALTSRAIYFNPNTDDDNRALARAFAQHLTSNQEQEQLVEQTNWLATNAATAGFVNNDPARAEMILQARSSMIVYEIEANRLIIVDINTAINQLLAERITAQEAANMITPEQSETDAP